MPEYEVLHEEVLPEGVYEFVCVDANEKTSQSGNVMIELELMVRGSNSNGGNEIRVFDHLVFTPKSTWKIDSFRVATGETLVRGQRSRFEAEDCVDRVGKVWLTVEKYDGRSRNKIGQYLDPAAEKPPPAANASSQAPAPPKLEKTLEQELKEKGVDPDDDIPMA